MRLKDIIESWSSLPGQKPRTKLEKSAKELRDEESRELGKRLKSAVDDPNEANRIMGRMGELSRAAQDEQAAELERQQTIP